MFKVTSFKKNEQGVVREQKDKQPITEILLNKLLLLQESTRQLVGVDCFLSADLYDALLRENMQLVVYTIRNYPDLQKSKVFQYSGVYFKLDMRMARGTADFIPTFKDLDARLKQEVYTLIVEADNADWEEV